MVERLNISLADASQVDFLDSEIEVWPEHTWYSDTAVCYFRLLSVTFCYCPLLSVTFRYYRYSDTTYRVSIDGGAIFDASSNGNAAMDGVFMFTTANTVAPSVEKVTSEMKPGNMATFTLEIDSLGAVAAGASSLSIVDSATNVTVRSISVADATQVSFPARLLRGAA